jgi:HEPN domain-containing protein
MSALTKQHLVQLAEEKLRDARILLQNGSGGNAYYLAGYAVELMFKAVLASQIRAETIPSRDLVKDLFTHDLNKLLGVADLRHALSERQDADPQFRGRWEVVLSWKETSRYDFRNSDEALELIEAIDEPQHGVLRWLKTML